MAEPLMGWRVWLHRVCSPVCLGLFEQHCVWWGAIDLTCIAGRHIHACNFTGIDDEADGICGAITQALLGVCFVGIRLFGRKSQCLEFILTQVQLRQLWLSRLHGAATFKVGWRPFLHLSTVFAGAPICGDSAFHTHADGLLMDGFCGASNGRQHFFVTDGRRRNVRAVCSLPELTPFANEKRALDRLKVS